MLSGPDIENLPVVDVLPFHDAESQSLSFHHAANLR